MNPVHDEASTESMDNTGPCQALWADVGPDHQEDAQAGGVGQGPAVDCPVCRSPLGVTVIEDEAVYSCEQCNGFLAPMDTFSVIVAKRRALHGPHETRTDPFHPADLERILYCPGCQKRMDTHPYFGGGNAVVDTCEDCGLIWLDAGDLATIERYVPYVHQFERTLTPLGGRYQGGPFDMPR